MKTIDYIKTNGLQRLTDDFHIIVKRHPIYPNLVFLKYNQIDSPMAEPIVQECRGLILDEANDWRIVSYPFCKFFNYGEGHAATIDWSTARVYEKLDGSLITLYWYAGAWQVASNGTPDAGGPVYGHSGTFADLFWKTWNELGYRLPRAPDSSDDLHYCYMFEMMTPYNRVVVPHSRSHLVFIGIREIDTLRECPVEVVGSESLGWERVRSFPLQSFDDCVTAAAALNPIESEGYVVCDANFNRVKVKSPQYVALSHMKDGFGPRRMLEIVRTNEGSEFLVHFPEFQAAYDETRGQFDCLCSDIEADYQRLAGIEVQKDFAIEALKTRCSSALFAMRKGTHKNAKEFFASGTVALLEKYIKPNVAELTEA